MTRGGKHCCGWAAAAAVMATSAFPGASAAASVPVYGAPETVGQVPAGGFVSQLAVADFNADAREDVIVTRSVYLDQQTFPVTVLVNDGRGKLVDATESIFSGAVPVTQNAREIVVADFNADGRADVFVADHGDDRPPFPGYQNTLILSRAGGKLVDATRNLPRASDFTHSAAAADANGDGTTDIYVGNIGGGNQVGPRILLGDGKGRFRIGGSLPAATVSLANRYTASFFTDFNSDTKPDLVLGAEDHTRRSELLLNDGRAHFTPLRGAFPAKPFGPDAIALDITAQRIDRDRHPDLLVAYTKGNPFYVGRWIQVLVNNGDGTLRDETSRRLPQSDNNDAWPMFIEQRDLNRDHRMDFGLRLGGGAGPAPFFLADARGVFRRGPTLRAGIQPWSYIDLDGDGGNDVVGVDFTHVVSVFREQGSPVVTGLELRPTAFRAARSGASVAAAKTGTTVRYRLSEPARATFTVKRVARGIMLGSSCVTPSAGRRGKRCTRLVAVRGSFKHIGTAGTNRFSFTGRLRRRALNPGNYRLLATPKDSAGNVGATASSQFRIVR